MWSQASLKELVVYILSCLTNSRRGQKYSLAARRAASEEEAQSLWHVSSSVLLSQAMRGASGAAARSRHRPSGRVKLPRGLFFWAWPRHCRAEPESASSSLFGYTKRLVQLGEKVIHFLENCTRFWPKRLGPRLSFSVLHVSFDAFAQMPGLYSCFWLRNRNGQALCEK